jgi:hypothetical protein
MEAARPSLPPADDACYEGTMMSDRGFPEVLPEDFLLLDGASLQRSQLTFLVFELVQNSARSLNQLQYCNDLQLTLRTSEAVFLGSTTSSRNILPGTAH